MLRDMYRQHGVECDTCQSVDELTDLMRTKDYDLLITDLKMPEVNGYEVLELLRTSEIGNSQTIPVVAATAAGYVEEEELIRKGFAAVLYKPYSIDELLAVTERCIKPKGTSNIDLSPLLAFGDKRRTLDLYRNDEKLANVYLLFSGIAVFIVCLGLFGISLYDIRRRYREIAIRKVNGARMKDLYLLLGRKYIATFLLAFIIATPVSWYIISVYSANFVMKAPVGISVFLFSFLLVAFVSLATIVFQLNKAVRINPSDVMKSE